MLRSLLRVVLAFLVACFAAALVQVLFAFSPAELAAPNSEFSVIGVLSIVPKAMVQSILFAAPFVLVAAAVAEWQGIQDWTYYTLVGVAIAFAGFTALHMGEGADRTLFHDYAMRAFLTTGAVAGFVYWMVGGRNAGGRYDDNEDVSGAGRGIRKLPLPSVQSAPQKSVQQAAEPQTVTRPDTKPSVNKPSAV